MISRSTLHFSLLATIGLVVVAGAGTLIGLAPSFIQQPISDCSCASMPAAVIPGWLWPTAGAAGLLLAVIAVSAARTWFATRRYLRPLLSNAQAQVRRLAGQTLELVIIPDSSAVFCFGYLHPRIAVGSRIFDRLRGQDVDAVVSHELAHARHRDPLRLFVATLVCRSVLRPFGGERMLQSYILSMELDADQRAIDAVGRHSLAQAFVELLTAPAPLSSPVVPFLNITETRIRRLLGDEAVPRLRGLFALAAGLILLAVAGLGASVQAARSTAVPASPAVAQCLGPAVCRHVWNQSLECTPTPAGILCVRRSVSPGQSTPHP